MYYFNIKFRQYPFIIKLIRSLNSYSIEKAINLLQFNSKNQEFYHQVDLSSLLKGLIDRCAFY